MRRSARRCISGAMSGEPPLTRAVEKVSEPPVSKIAFGDKAPVQHRLEIVGDEVE